MNDILLLFAYVYGPLYFTKLINCFRSLLFSAATDSYLFNDEVKAAKAAKAMIIV